jgi:single-strand DNA-binding protein
MENLSMSDLSACMITGRLTANSELKYSNKGMPSLRFCVAVGRYEKGKTDTSFFDCIQWGKIAEPLSQKLTKGKPVAVRGEFRQEHWQDKEGQKRSRWILVADMFGVQPLSLGQKEGQQEVLNIEEEWDEDIPF